MEVFDRALHDRKSNYCTCFDVDFVEIGRFDRYKADASRPYQRSLKNLQTIKKMAHGEECWQLQLVYEKQKLANW